MNISSYEIELPINKLSPYQQLYRGRHKNGQVYLLHIFPRQYLTQEMIDQISFREKQFDFVFEKIESKEAILISYLDSAFWINLEQQIKIEQLKSLYQQLYQKYSILDGNLDFNPDFIFTYEGQIFVLDYGIDDFVTKKYRDFEYTTKTKTYLFGLLLLNLNCPKSMTDKIYQCKDQYQIDYYIKQEAENNHLNYDILESILKMVKLDPTQRPTFQELGQWRLFYQKQQVKKHSSSVIDFTNTIIPSNNTTSFHSSQRAIKQQNYQTNNQLDSIHNESVRAAIQKQQRQIPISNYKCSSYDFASATMTKNLQNKKQSASNINKNNITQQTFYQNGNGQQNSQQSAISNYKTQNYFIYQKPVLSQQKLQQPLLSRDSNKSQQVQKLERNSPFMSDGSQIPDIIINKPVMNHVANAQKIVKHSNNDISTRYHQNQQITNLSYLNVPNSNQTEKFQNTQIPNSHINQDNSKSPFLNLPNQQLKESINIDKEEYGYQNKQQEGLKQHKLKTPAQVQLNTKEDDKIEDLILSDQVNSNQNTIQTKQKNQQIQGKKQEFIKKPLQDYQIITPKPNLDQKYELGNKDYYQQNPQNLEILDFQDPKFLIPQDQFNRNQDNQIQQNVKFADYIKKYFHYLSIIEYIFLTVNDLNQKLLLSGKQWIVPLALVYKRGYVIRRLLLQDVQQEKNIFEFPDFIAFKQSQQYQQMQATITQQNEKVEKEFQIYLEKACSYLITMEDTSQQKLGPQLTLNLKTCTKIQTQKYLYTQLYPKIKSSLAKAQAGNLQNNQFLQRDWIQSKLLCLYTILIIDLDLYQMESQNFKESTFIEYRKNKDNDLVQIHCNELEITINKLPQFNA
ncbi:unnamed protein product [Paramecium octaurelia]|uniref:Protein kinase domain-containing protein n=1 Tax=Paramecium octaurelia TaxID=43137 RepID=A0A8S1SDY5_PAROT|nr:unnamed protein product [Paramecium octaurelia]